MWTLLGRIFGGKKAAESLVDTGLGLIDKAFYTERGEGLWTTCNTGSKQPKAVTAWLQTSGGPNLARRFIAMGIFGMWFALWATSVIIDIISIWILDPFIRESMQQVIQRTKEYAGDITPEFMLVLGYYFAAPQLDKFISPLAEKIARKNGSNQPASDKSSG